MLERMLSPKARTIFLVVTLLILCAIVYLGFANDPLVDPLFEIQDAIIEPRGDKRSLKFFVVLAAFPACAIGFIPAILYDFFTRQGKFEK